MKLDIFFTSEIFELLDPAAASTDCSVFSAAEVVYSVSVLSQPGGPGF